ncbi:uncharacterized protein LOC119742856 [Patiria miniata]|uniref:Septin-type G domain-containing protein n=1 Tax=Patiria miniata TaxID=46514 RepID=A0A914BFG6_PATMI|nr:uncharacterized protein LOC119742856 [Patiria miniata]
MVVGEAGAGKSTLINTMINYIFGVKWEDNFRFKLVDEHGTGAQSQAHSQTQIISSYTIHSNEQHNIPYTLTIIDTPGFGDTRGIERDRAIVEQIREFCSHPEAHGVDHIDAVGFVVQSSQARLTPTQQYIFDSILSIFGEDIEPNILLLITFSDGQSPPVLEAVKKAKLPFSKTFKFNNSALLASRGDGGMSFDAMFWQMGYTSMKEFFDSLDHLQPRSFTLTVEVLDEQKRLEIALEGLQPQIQLASHKRAQLNEDKQMFEEREQDIEANKYFAYGTEVRKPEKNRDEEKPARNCPNCRYTCHYPCTFAPFNYFCHAMSWGGYCTVCPGKCSSGDHVKESFIYRWKTVREKQAYADIENRYRDAYGQKQSREEMINKIETDLANAEAAVYELIQDSHRCTQRLEQIALKPNPVRIEEYLDMLIETEKATKNKGWEKRVGSLEAIKIREDSKNVVKDAAAWGSTWGDMFNNIFRELGLQRT